MEDKRATTGFPKDFLDHPSKLKLLYHCNKGPEMNLRKQLEAKKVTDYNKKPPPTTKQMLRRSHYYSF